MRHRDERPTAEDYPLMQAAELLKFQQSWDQLQELKAKAEGMPIKVGHAYRLNISPGNPNNCKLHVRAIVDINQIVVAVHSKHRGWQYRIEHRASLQRWWDQGKLTEARS